MKILQVNILTVLLILLVLVSTDTTNNIKEKQNIEQNKEIVKPLVDKINFETRTKIYSGVTLDLINKTNQEDLVFIEDNNIYLVTSSYYNNEVTKEELPEIKEEFTGYISGDKVNLRDKATRKSDSLYKFKLNTKVSYTKHNKNWVKICYKEELGYVSTKYISDKKIVKKKEVIKEEPKLSITCYKTYDYDTFRRLGIVRYGNYRYTWYSQKVLPGGGLIIPGRHINDEGIICDENGYICVAADCLPFGTIIDTPLGIRGKVYDCGPGSDKIDIYCNW